MRKIVVIGGDAAGMSAAARASRGGESVQIVVLERGEITSYAACGLPYLVSGIVEDASDLVIRTPEEHRATGLDVRTRHEVTAIDVENRTLEVHSLNDGRVYHEPFDDLLIATGANPIHPPFPNLDAQGIVDIKTIPDAVALDELIRTRSPKRAVVVGGGYIGIEMVEALQLRGLEVTMVERLDQPMNTLDPDMGTLIAGELRELGVDLHLGTGVIGFEKGSDGWVTAVATEAGEFPADLVVLGLGFRPNVQLAKEAGIPIGVSGAIATDARMQTRIPGIWAAGDCAESLHRITGSPIWIPLGTHANKQGRVVGDNLTGRPSRFPGVIGTAVTKVHTLEIGRTGLTEREAKAAGFDAVGNTIKGQSRAHYYPGHATLAVKIVVERTSGRMLGAQIVGGPEAAKRIDPLAVAIWNEMTADEFSMLDLGYAPPYSPTWDPILISARLASRRAHAAQG